MFEATVPVIQRRPEPAWQANRDARAYVFVGSLAALALVFAYLVRGLLGPFIIAGIVAFLLNPLVNAAERRRVPRAVAVLALYGIFGVLIGMAVVFLVPLVRQEFVSLQARGPAIAQYLQDLASNRHVVSVLGVEVDLRQSYDSAVANLPTLLAGHLQSVLDNLFRLINWLFELVLVLLVAFFLITDSHSIRRFFRNLVPPGARGDAHALAHDIHAMLGAYMRGELIICGLIGLVTAVALALVGVPYALALGIVAGATAFIPFIGPVLGALPAVAMAAFVSQSVGKVVLVIVLYAIISNAIYNFVAPKVLGDAVHLSPLLIIVAFVLGGYLGGILGLFLAVPVAATLRILFLYIQERVYA